MAGRSTVLTQGETLFRRSDRFLGSLGRSQRIALICVSAMACSWVISTLIYLCLDALLGHGQYAAAVPPAVIGLVGIIASFVCAAPAAVLLVGVFDHLRSMRSDLTKALRQAEAASVAKSAFLANMSHEIRTPLNGVLGMAQILQMSDIAQEQKEHVAVILESGQTLMALLNDILDLSKIEAGKFEIAPTDASLHQMLRRQAMLWRPRAQEKGLDFTLDLDPNLPDALSFDQVRVQQCLANLASNAIKFTSAGRVRIHAAAFPSPSAAFEVRISVTDTGPGMTDETLGRLFQAFSQADATTAGKFGGTGLGLSITRRLAELMGGTASATSEIAKGSVFSFSFQAGSASVASTYGAATVEARREVGDVRRGLRVLLVDDNRINRQVASLLLRPFEMTIAEAADGQEALEALKREPFDLVLLDMQMPVMDGPTTIRAIRGSGGRWANIPVVALTANAMAGDRERYLGMGMNGYLAKPLSERDMISEISRVGALAA